MNMFYLGTTRTDVSNVLEGGLKGTEEAGIIFWTCERFELPFNYFCK